MCPRLTTIAMASLGVLTPCFLVDMDTSLSAHTRDFLHIFAETALTANYLAAGVVCALSTNSPLLLEAARDSFLPLDSCGAKPDISLRFWVDGGDSPGPPWPKPYLRGLDDMVFAGFDDKSSLIADLANRKVLGRFSAAIANDTKYWRTTIFPMPLRSSPDRSALSNCTLRALPWRKRV